MEAINEEIFEMIMEHVVPDSHMIDHFIDRLVVLGGTHKENSGTAGNNGYRYYDRSVIIGSDLYIYVTGGKTRKQLEPRVLFAVFMFDDKIVVYDGYYKDYMFYKVDYETKAEFLVDIPAICFIHKTLSSKGIVGMSKSEYRLSLVASRVKSARN